MLDGAATVKIHGGYVPVRAEIDSLPMLSAHADADEILRWLRGFERAPGNLHRAWRARRALRLRIKDELGWRCRAVEQNDVAELAGRAALPARAAGQSFQAVARALGQRSPRARRTARRTADAGLRRGDQLPGPQGVAAQAFGRHGQSGAARAASSAV